MAETRVPEMAKKKGRPKKPGGEGGVVRIDRSILAKAKLIAADRDGMDVSELLSDILRAPIDRAYAQMLRKLEGES